LEAAVDRGIIFYGDSFVVVLGGIG